MKSIFVSSTFKDMQAERDALQYKVLPKLNEFAEQYGQIIELIDLRLGINTQNISEEEQNRKVLRTCLNEIDRSRPFFIGIIGNRYGYIPSKKDITDVLSEKNLQCDDNKSVTALEIEYGALSSLNNPQCFFYFRSKLDYSILPAEGQLIYCDKGIDAALLMKMKNEISEKISNIPRYYPATINNSGISELDEFCSLITNDLIEALKKEWGDIPESKKTWQEEEEYALNKFRQIKSGVFVGRNNEIEKLKDFSISTKTNHKIKLLHGKSGIGKTSLMCALMDTLEKENCYILSYCCGITPRTSTIDSMFRYFIHKLSSYLNELDDSNSIMGFERLKNRFYELLDCAAEKNRVVCIIDAVDQLSDTAETRTAKWIFSDLSENCRMIISVIEGEDISSYRELGIDIQEIPPVNIDDIELITHSLLDYHHKNDMPDEIIRSIVYKKDNDNLASANPLYLSLLIQSVIMMGKKEFAEIDKYTKDGLQPMDAIIYFLQKYVSQIPCNISGIYHSVLEKIKSVVGYEFVEAILTVIAMSRYGLREKDLKVILTSFNVEYNSADFSWLRYLLNNSFYQRDSLQWDFMHKSLRTVSIPKNTSEQIQINDVIKNYFMSILPYDELAHKEILYHLYIADEPQTAAIIISNENNEKYLSLYLLCLTDICYLDKQLNSNNYFIDKIIQSSSSLPYYDICRLGTFLQERFYAMLENIFSVKELIFTLKSLIKLLEDKKLECNNNQKLNNTCFISVNNYLHKQDNNGHFVNIRFVPNFSEKEDKYTDLALHTEKESKETLLGVCYKKQRLLGKLYIMLGNLFTKLNDNNQAIDHYASGTNIFEIILEEAMWEDDVENLSLCYKKIGEYFRKFENRYCFLFEYRAMLIAPKSSTGLYGLKNYDLADFNLKAGKKLIRAYGENPVETTRNNALNCLQESLVAFKDLYAKTNNIQLLRNASEACKSIGTAYWVLFDNRKRKEAEAVWDEAVEIAKNVYEKTRSISDLDSLVDLCLNIGSLYFTTTIKENGKIFVHTEKYLSDGQKYTDRIYQITKTKESLKQKISALNNYSGFLGFMKKNDLVRILGEETLQNTRVLINGSNEYSDYKIHADVCFNMAEWEFEYGDKNKSYNLFLESQKYYLQLSQMPSQLMNDSIELQNSLTFISNRITELNNLSKLQIMNLLSSGEINKAEDLLFENLETNFLDDLFEVAYEFYKNLRTYNNAWLVEHNFSSQEVEDGWKDFQREFFKRRQT
jgi:hypothetical protein